jgi:hypothetical protein
VERIARKIATDKVRKKTWLNTDANLIEIEREFTDTLGTRVQISKTDFGGKLTIDYFSEDDLQKLLSIVKSQGKITDFHTAGTDVPKDTQEEELNALTHATGLERAEAPVPVVAEEPIVSVPPVAATPEEPRDILQAPGNYAAVEAKEVEGTIDIREAIQSEEAVSEVIEDVVVDAAQYAQEHEATPPSVPDVPAPTGQQEKKEDDDGLYSIRNFSL